MRTGLSFLGKANQRINKMIFLSVSKVSGGSKQCKHGSVTFRFTSSSGRYTREELEHPLP